MLLLLPACCLIRETRYEVIIVADGLSINRQTCTLLNLRCSWITLRKMPEPIVVHFIRFPIPLLSYPQWFLAS